MPLYKSYTLKIVFDGLRLGGRKEFYTATDVTSFLRKGDFLKARLSTVKVSMFFMGHDSKFLDFFLIFGHGQPTSVNTK